ncbi:hypothetical protein GW926_04095 [Candidatus Pacearchaeota archaeon]|nr:hypothetical protein [Candidatus Pacearchaeota archaeon]
MTVTKKKISNLRVKQQALYIMIFSFVTVLIWIMASLFRSQKKTGIAPDLLELAKPLSPTINVDVIDSIEERKAYSDQELFDFQIYKIIKSKDGRTQQVVPIDSNLDEIPEEEIQVIIQENNQVNPSDRLSNQSNLEEQIGSGDGTFVPELNQLDQPSERRGSDNPGFGADGRYYLD